MIEFHYVHTPNALKITIMLEELSIDYRRVYYDLLKGDHLKPQFRLLNPNNRLPLIRDLAPTEGTDPLTVFESGAVLIYLSEKTDMLSGNGVRSRAQVLQWLMWQMSGLGPMGGQFAHFARYSPDGQPYAQERYRKEFIRLLNVLEYRLREVDFLAGDYSIADIACWPWINSASGWFNLDDFPALLRWKDAIGMRPAVVRAQSTAGIPDQLVINRTELTPEEWANVYGDNVHAAARPEHRPDAEYPITGRS